MPPPYKNYNLRKRKLPTPPPSEPGSGDDADQSDTESEKQFVQMLNKLAAKSIKKKQRIPQHDSTDSFIVPDSPDNATKETEKKGKTILDELSDYNSEEDSDYETLDAEEDETDEDTKNKNIIIVNAAGGDNECEEDDEEALEEGEDEECNSDDEQTFMPEQNACRMIKDVPPESPRAVNISDEYTQLYVQREWLSEMAKTDSVIYQPKLDECVKKMRDLVKSARYKNAQKYFKMIYSAGKTKNEMEYFKTKLSNKEQIQAMNEMEEINRHLCIEKPYRLLLLQTSIPSKYKAIAMQKLNMLKSMGTSNSEYYKLKNWVDAFMKIPFGIYRHLSIRMEDGVDRCDEFMTNAKNTLDNCVHGMTDAKLQIMQMLGQWVANPASVGSAIAIHGPPGTGKTSIVKDGISKIMGRDFAFIALGGCGDSSFLEGHSYTYEGSMWGRIVQILMESKSMNPVIYFDELDKVSDTARGQEIIGVLTHLTDTSQNSQFHDKYFSEVDFDLSKCLFIFSYNDESAVNPILKDRMYRIKTNGYDAKDKLVIAKKHMIPKICEQVSMSPGDIIIPDDVLSYIIQSQSLTKGEQGVRNLKRCLELIYTKLNLFRIVKPGSDLLKPFMDMKVSFPYTVSKKDLDVLIKKDEPINLTLLSMYI